MKSTPTLTDISLRTELQPGDLGYVTYLHGALYKKEYGYGVDFEAYVAKGLCEFYEHYNPKTNRIWMAEHRGERVGFLLLMNRGNAAQLRYFIILPEYRGIGLGNMMMEQYMQFLRACNYQSSYLWTTHELYTAAHLYKKNGFKLTEEKDSDAFGKPLKENKYELVLN